MANLNERQRTILKALCAYLLIATIFPPYHREYPGGANLGLGYGFLLSPPVDDHGMLSIGQLMVQWILGIVVAGAANMLTPQADKDVNPAPNDDLKKALTRIDALSEMLHAANLQKDELGSEVAKLKDNLFALEKQAQDAKKVTAYWQKEAMRDTSPPDPNQKALL